MTAWDDMIAGRPYRPGDPHLFALRRRAQERMRVYNTRISGDPDRDALLRDMLGSVGERCGVRGPVHLDYGLNVHLGDDVFLNYGCVLLDVCPITLGDGCQIGPGVQFLAADHPREPKARAEGWESGRPITLGRNVWVGGGALFLPGVTVGADAIVGAGAVVTRDVAPGTTVVGNPARPIG